MNNKAQLHYKWLYIALISGVVILSLAVVESDMEFRLIQNYFTGVNSVHFVLKKVNEGGEQIITIK